jgi:hypothetical protein
MLLASTLPPVEPPGFASQHLFKAQTRILRNNFQYFGLYFYDT